MKDSILTTAQAAKILGVSARTAQLWTESGVIPNWKTPGGHRRMFEADVRAILERGGDLVQARSAHAAAPLPAELLNAPFPISDSEPQRLMAVHRSGILDSASEENMDNLAKIAALSLSAPIALITVLSEDRQWFKAKVGLEMAETPRSWAFCNYTVLQSGVEEFADLQSDARFADNPAVKDAPYFRFYAGAPVSDEQGYALGSLCVIDTEPRQLSATHTEILSRLASLVTAEIIRGMRSAPKVTSR